MKASKAPRKWDALRKQIFTEEEIEQQDARANKDAARYRENLIHDLLFRIDGMRGMERCQEDEIVELKEALSAARQETIAALKKNISLARALRTYLTEDLGE